MPPSLQHARHPTTPHHSHRPHRAHHDNCPTLVALITPITPQHGFDTLTPEQLKRMLRERAPAGERESSGAREALPLMRIVPGNALSGGPKIRLLLPTSLAGTASAVAVPRRRVLPSCQLRTFTVFMSMSLPPPSALTHSQHDLSPPMRRHTHMRVHPQPHAKFPKRTCTHTPFPQIHSDVLEYEEPFDAIHVGAAADELHKVGCAWAWRHQQRHSRNCQLKAAARHGWGISLQKPRTASPTVNPLAHIAMQELMEKLAAGGRMVIPVGPRYGHQVLMAVDKDEKGAIKAQQLMNVGYVPLTRPSEMEDGGQGFHHGRHGYDGL